MLPVCLVIASTVQYLECRRLLLVTSATDLPLRTIKCCSVVFGGSSDVAERPRDASCLSS